jgi:hypothetical protein
VFVLVAVSAASVLPVVEFSTPVITFTCIVAISPVCKLLSQAFPRIVLGVHEVETTLLMSAWLLAVRLDSRSHLEDRIRVGGEEFRRSETQRWQGRGIFFLGDLGESCEGLKANFGGGEDDVGGRVVDPFNAHWFLSRAITSKLFDIFCGHFIDAANMHFFVDRFIGEGVKGGL